MNKKATVICLTILAAACSPISQQAKQELTQPVNCATAEEDIRILEQERAHVGKQIASGVTAITPVGAVLGILTGTEGEKLQVATGEYNRMIDEKIAEIKRTCRAGRTKFQDILVPKGLKLHVRKTTIIESPTARSARLTYKGRLEPQSLAVAFRATLEANGWRHISSTLAKEGTTQVYEKNGDSLQVRIWEGWWYTWAEVTVTQVVTVPSPAGR